MYLYGASGHAKVIIEILEAPDVTIEGLFDDNNSIKSLLKYPVQQFTLQEFKTGNMVISIGSNIIRRKIASYFGCRLWYCCSSKVDHIGKGYRLIRVPWLWAVQQLIRTRK